MEESPIPHDIENIALAKYPPDLYDGEISSTSHYGRTHDFNYDAREGYIQGKLDERSDTIAFTEWICEISAGKTMRGWLFINGGYVKPYNAFQYWLDNVKEK